LTIHKPSFIRENGTGPVAPPTDPLPSDSVATDSVATDSVVVDSVVVDSVVVDSVAADSDSKGSVGGGLCMWARDYISGPIAPAGP
jgi:hypothetical protein